MRTMHKIHLLLFLSILGFIMSSTAVYAKDKARALFVEGSSGSTSVTDVYKSALVDNNKYYDFVDVKKYEYSISGSGVSGKFSGSNNTGITLDKAMDTVFSASTEQDVLFFIYHGHPVVNDEPEGKTGVGGIWNNYGYTCEKFLKKIASYKHKYLFIINDCIESWELAKSFDTLANDQKYKLAIYYIITNQSAQQYSEFNNVKRAISPMAFTVEECMAAARGSVTSDELGDYLENHGTKVAFNMYNNYYGTDYNFDGLCFRYISYDDMVIYSTEEPVNPVPSNITFGKTNIEAYVGDYFQIPYVLTGDESSVSWSVGDCGIANVGQGGWVRAIKKGTTEVSASIDGHEACCTITVEKKRTKLSKSTLEMKVGESTTIKATVFGPSKNTVWKSSNQNVASVNQSGKITAKASGTTVVSVTANGITASCQVTVTKPKFKLVQSNISVIVGESLKLDVQDADPKKSLKWKSSNNNVASISSKGQIKAKNVGSTTITVTQGGKKSKCKIKVVKKIDMAQFLGMKVSDFIAKFPDAQRGNQSRYKGIGGTPEVYGINEVAYYIYLCELTMKGYNVLGIEIGMDSNTACKILEKKGWKRKSSWRASAPFYDAPKNWKKNSGYQWTCEISTEKGKVKDISLGSPD